MKATLPAAALLAIAVAGCESKDPAASSVKPPAGAPTSTPSVIDDVKSAMTAKKINLNTATEAEFMAGVPDLSHRMVHEFLEYRPYVSITQFRKEMGKYVDDATIAGYEKHVFVPIVPGECDAATLQQIPGVTAAIATKLIEGRPYGSVDEFLAALKTHVDPQSLAAAGSYLAAP